VGQAQSGTYQQPVPRWRLLAGNGQRPDRLALRIAHHLSNPEVVLPFWGNPRYIAVASGRPLGLMLVAACETPVGCAADSLTSNSVPDLAWCNATDRLLMRRQMAPAMLRLVKLAAQQAVGGKLIRLSSLFLTPLPHRRGELLVRSSSGWTGRARAWTHCDCMLAVVWKV
jgi:hypothetical protein